VEYEPREFLLHLFALLCREVLKAEEVKGDPDFDDAPVQAQDWLGLAPRRAQDARPAAGDRRGRLC
jgi:hypothetical protein